MRKILLFLLLLCAVSEAFAATRSTENTGERLLRDQRQKRERQQFERAPEIETPSQILPTRKEGEPCFPITNIELEGNTKLSSAEIESIVAPNKERGCVSSSDVRALLLALTNRYIEGGWITTRVYFKSKGLKEGTLTLVAVEGKIAKLTINPEEKNIWSFRDRISEYTAFPQLEGEVLNLKDLEQGIDQMQRLPSVKAKVRLEPGKEVGTSNIVVDKKLQDRVRGSVGYDNYGSTETGSARYKAIFEIDDPLALNESWFATYIGSKNTNAIAGSVSMPYGYWTHRLDASYSEYLIALGNASDTFGMGYSTTYTAERVIYRDKARKASIHGGLSSKRSGRFINDIELDPQPLTVARMGGKYFQRGKGYVWTAESAVAQGLEYLGAKPDPEATPENAAHAQFEKWDGISDYSLQLAPLGTFRTQAEWQYARQTLYGAEQISVGGPENVRGFSDQSINGDTGGSLRNSLYLAWPESVKTDEASRTIAENVSPFLFADIGATRAHTEKHYDALAGAGAGLSVSLGKINAELSLAMPAYTSEGIERKSGTVLYVSLLAKLF